MPHLLRCRNDGIAWFIGGLFRNIARRLGIDPGIGWLTEADRACSHLTANDVDVILASGPPFVAFALAKRLSDRLGRPYVLDYRDPWTDFPHALRPARPATIRKEAELLAGCTAATIVSQSWASALDRRFGVGLKLHVVTNGYDAEELGHVQPTVFGHFAIVYAGIFYVPKRAITPVMAALKMLDDASTGRPEWHFHYYGPHGTHVNDEAKRFGLAHRIILHGTLSRPEVLAAVRGAAVAVVITSIVDNAELEDKGMVTGKIFETLGLQTPILLVAPFGSDARDVVQNAGVGPAFTASDAVGIASFLSDMMRNGVRRPTNAAIYEWTNIAEKLNSILRGVIAVPPRTRREDWRAQMPRSE